MLFDVTLLHPGDDDDGRGDSKIFLFDLDRSAAIFILVMRR